MTIYRCILICFLTLFTLAVKIATAYAEPVPEAVSNIPDPQSAPILSYPRDYVAVQLLAVRERQAVLNFIENNQLGDRHWGAIRVDGESWYVLLLGVYRNRLVAEQALAALPDTAPPVQPWLRPFGPLKDAIAAGL